MAKTRAPHPPYKSSWQNLFFDRMDELPGSGLYPYLYLFVSVAIILHLVPWVQGILPWGKVVWSQFGFLIPALAVLIIFGNLISSSERALSIFRPALGVTDGEYAILRYRFINIPWIQGWIITIVVVVFVYYQLQGRFIQNSFPAFLLHGISGAVVFLTVSLGLTFVFTFFFFVFRQARWINWFYGQVKNVNVFNLAPLYALSGVSSSLGMLAILTGTLSFLINFFLMSGNPQIAINIFFGVINLALAIILFILPAWGIHVRLRSEKEKIWGENSLRLVKINRDLERQIDQKKFSRVADLRHGIAALLDLRREIEKVSTWPWQPGTLRNFISALFLPISLWLIQGVLSRFLFQ